MYSPNLQYKTNNINKVTTQNKHMQANHTIFKKEKKMMQSELASANIYGKVSGGVPIFCNFLGLMKLELLS